VWLLCALGAAGAGCQVHLSLLDDGPPVALIGASYRTGAVTVNPDAALEPAQTWWQRRGASPAAAPPTTGDVVRVANKSTDTPGADAVTATHEVAAVAPPVPGERAKIVHPTYVIESPDVLALEPVRIVPRPNYHIEPSDVLAVQAAEGASGWPISGRFCVRADGTVHLGSTCGTVRLAGQTLEQAAETVRVHLSHVLHEPQTAVALADFRGVRQTRGLHRVAADGSITLGTYGNVKVAGLDPQQAKEAVERHLSKYLLNPEVSVSVAAANSKAFYVIQDGGVFGLQVFRFPSTGSDTVLDAVCQIQGSGPMTGLSNVWLARPDGQRGYRILPVHWQELAAGGDSAVNFRLYPGDRVYVKACFPVALQNYLGQVFAPVEDFFRGSLLQTDPADAGAAKNRGS
jgi:polysaccharide export outer membrane protein